jgi:DNA gyrase subunit A
MKLKGKDELISMDILPSQVVASLVAAENAEVEEEAELDAVNATEEQEMVETAAGQGPWILVVTMGGYGKRVPVNQFRLQNRAGMGILATKFRLPKDTIAALRVVNEGDELMMVTSRGIIIRQAIKAISPQSRMATGVRVQRLDEDDAIAAVALVPLAGQEDAGSEEDLEVLEVEAAEVVENEI